MTGYEKNSRTSWESAILINLTMMRDAQCKQWTERTETCIFSIQHIGTIFGTFLFAWFLSGHAESFHCYRRCSRYCRLTINYFAIMFLIAKQKSSSFYYFCLLFSCLYFPLSFSNSVVCFFVVVSFYFTFFSVFLGPSK